ncbi:hypothetical protein [Komagataeibacter oboediens]|uniref:hypothetical protein n=1 Tax=Komagataeibacter oboediens TaxID=65958 RepID=UPI00200C9358|nr:hypothetical protein [Komagataeibacter oboediens]MCK9820793.1 hypothetical protein [Komagataeibacter oboediens]
MSEKLENSAIHAALIQAAANLTGSQLIAAASNIPQGKYKSPDPEKMANVFALMLEKIEEKWEQHAQKHHKES